MLVLFQPENPTGLGSDRTDPCSITTSTSVEESQTLEETIRAPIVSLAAKKSGAIIVLEREIELKDIVEMGVPLDAKVSKELLISIFLSAFSTS